MEKFHVHIYLRHYVHDEQSFENYKKIIARIVKAKKLVPFNFNVLVNYSRDASRDLKDRIMELSEKMIENDVGFTIAVGHGAGTALFNLMEESISNVSVDKSKAVVIVIDGDSYNVDDHSMLRRIRNLATKVIDTGAILGLAQRASVKLPVVKSDSLAMEKMEMFREIDEIYLAMAMKNKPPVANSREVDAPGAYKEFGDPVPGFYCVNITHKNFPEIIRMVEKDAIKSDMTKFAGDCYMVLAASTLGKIVTEIIPLADNPPGSFLLSTITSKAAELGRTSLRQMMLDAVKSDDNKRALERFYPTEYVDRTRSMIMKGLLTK